jgi:guanylate kinase
MEKGINAAALEWSETTRKAYETVSSSIAAAQERNVQFAQSVFEQGVEQLRAQEETARGLFQAMAEQSEKQRLAWQKLAQESVNAYLDLLAAPIAFYQKGLDVTRQTAQKAR